MEISASAVKELRERTGAGMMDCKNALAEMAGTLRRLSITFVKKVLPKLPRRLPELPRTAGFFRIYTRTASSGP